MEHVVEIFEIKDVTHNVRSYRFKKPHGYEYIPGQATDVSINKPGWENEKRPFTFTSLSDAPFLEFTIKSYADHPGVTNELRSLKPGDSLIISDVWGAIEYKGPGYFIAGGAGITPFIAILRMLKKENKVSGNKLFFSNRTSKDVIYEDELTDILGRENVIYTLTSEQKEGYDSRYINGAFLQKEVSDFKKHFYICGPDPMIKQINDTLIAMGASAEEVVFEK